jgi:prophage regulatory protein
MNSRKIYRIDEICERTGLSKASIYKQIRLNKFPQGIKITDRSTGWSSDVIDSWIDNKVTGGQK